MYSLWHIITTIVTSTLTFDDTSKRTSYSTTQQIWTENGVTFTNNKASSSSSVADVCNPIKCFKNSQVIIEVTGNITKISFVCDSSSYGTSLVQAIKAIGGNATKNGSNVIVKLNRNSNSYTFTCTGGVIWLKSLTVSYIS